MKCTNLLVAAILAVPTILLAQTEPTPAQIAQHIVQRYTISLTLSSTQQEEALTLFTAEQTTEVPIRTSERLAHQLLDTAIKANNTATITEISTMLGQLSGQIMLAHSLADAQFYLLLTADQQTKFAQMMVADPNDGSSGPGGGPPRK